MKTTQSLSNYSFILPKSSYNWGRWLILSFVLFIVSNLSASDGLHFKTIGLKDGLSQVTGFALHEDEFGRMWIGTRDGLNCWDGEHMQTFYPTMGDSLSLIEPAVLKIVAHNSYLWLLSKPGISRLDLRTLSIRRYYFDNPGSICVYDGTVLVSSSKGLMRFNNKTNEFENMDMSFVGDKKATALTSDGTNLWLGTNKGELYKLHQSNIEHIPFNNSSKITAITYYNNNLWLGTDNAGVCKFDLNNGKISYYNTESKPYFLPANKVRDIKIDNGGNAWVGTFNGLCRFDLENEHTTIYTHDENNPSSLVHNSIYGLYIDSHGILWVGTYFGGVCYTDITKETFNYYDTPENQPSHPVIGNMVNDKNKNIWIATEGNGIDYYNRTKSSFINYPKSGDNSGPSEANVRSILLARDSLLLIGTIFGGMNVLNLNSKKFDHLNDLKGSEFYPPNINCITPFRGKFLLGTNHSGITVYDHNKRTFKPFFSDPAINDTLGTEINAIYFDTNGNLWLGSVTRGLFKYTVSTGKLVHYISDESNPRSIGYSFIVDIREDKKLRLWISTAGGGLSRYNPSTDDFTNYTTETYNIPSNFINGWAESRFGNLWISTTKGLSRFDVENDQFYNYGVASGFPLLELNKGSILLTQDGELFVGGIDGLTSFFEENIVIEQDDYDVFLSELFINNEKITSNGNPLNLTKDIAYADTIILYPDDKEFTIAYSSTNYNRIPRNKYQYMLEGFNNNWVNAEFKSMATFMNISPGKYFFRVRGTDAAYNSFTEERVISIIIKSPWYRTKLAFVFYFLIFAGIYMTLQYFLINKRKLTSKLKLEEEEKLQMKQMNQMKLRFFTNISHEFLTPLTLVIGSIENIFDMHEISGLAKTKLNRALRNAMRLRKLTQELLDFRKLEQGYMQLKISEHNINKFIDEVYTSFLDYAKVRNISITFNHNVTDAFVWIDSHQFEKVIYNLLSNSIKHVNSSNGKVEINTIDSHNEFTIKVADNGNGIKKEEIPMVFNRFFQSADQKNPLGSGIGLALCESIINAHKGTISCNSELGVGTTFTIKLKKGYEHLPKESLIFESEDHNFSLIYEGLHDMEQDQEKLQPEVSEDSPMMLVVDDNEEIRQLLTDIFNSMYSIEIAKDGEEGFEKALELQPDIIVSDIMMPKVSGSEMCKKLKRNINTSHIPIIMLTALNSEDDKIKNLDIGADDYITKPFNARLLKARIDNIFKNREILASRILYNPDENLTKITQSPLDQSFMEQTQKVIAEHMSDADFSIDKFASIMGQSRTVFFKKIKSISGQTPNELIQTVRLNKAAEMIIHDVTKNISEVAYDVGFNSARYFTQCFKQHFGVPPTQYGK